MADGPRYLLRPGVRADADEFSALAERAELAVTTGDQASALLLYENALRLWRGEPLADVDLLSAHPAVVNLTWQRSAVVVAYAEVASTTGWNEKVLGHLQALTAAEPLNERAHALLMMAMTASGQRAAALKLYAGLSDRLDQELGVRPGPSWRRRTITRCGRMPTPRPTARTMVTGPERGRSRRSTSCRPTAGTSPAGPPNWRSSRDADRADASAPGTVVISAIGGTAGVGKTALALYWARQVADRFPDGQLYVNLRGYDPEQPLLAADALAGFLRTLGVPGQDIPAELDERAARYRSLLAAGECWCWRTTRDRWTRSARCPARQPRLARWRPGRHALFHRSFALYIPCTRQPTSSTRVRPVMIVMSFRLTAI